MLDDLFQPLTDINLFENNDKTKLNCASYITKPEGKRSEVKFVGLFNQGGTCYMNSSLQVLYMNPILRQIIFDLPLSNDVSLGSEIMGKGQKYEILTAIQKLFANLYGFDIRAIDTLSLTNAFKWSGVEGSYQQDSQEFIRIFLFDVLERALIGTPFDGVINNLFKTYMFSYLICSNCGNKKIRDEESLDILLPVKDNKSVLESLNNLFNSFEVINDYKCDLCDKRVDVTKNLKIKELPIILKFSLNRFDWDWNTGERVKITSEFSYPLELNMKDFVDDNVKIADTEYDYELSAIIIHRGTPYSGHYFSYIRDSLKEGIWNIQNITELKKEPEKNSEEEKLDRNIKPAGKKKKKGKMNKDDEEYMKLNFDECEYPIPYNNKELADNWFCFDDTSITPISVGRLIKQFKSSESAYVLFYTKKNINLNKTILPDYLNDYIINENKELNIKREEYDDALKTLNISIYEDTNFYIDEFGILTPLSNFEDIPYNNMKLKYYNNFDIIEKEPGTVFYEVSNKKYNNSLVVISRYDENISGTLEDIGIRHQGLFIKIGPNSKLNKDLIDKSIGHTYEPIVLHILYLSENKKIKVYNNMKLDEFKDYLKNLFHIDFDISIIVKLNNKNNCLDKHGFDKKNNTYLTLKQLRLNENDIIFIQKQSIKKTIETNEQYDEKINCLVRFEDDTELLEIIKIRLNKTFQELVEKIKKKLEIECDIRLRKELDNKIIYKNQYENKLYSEEMFIDGGVRLMVEYGEPYESNDFLLKIIFDTNGEKILKDFIGDPKKISVIELKKFICTQFDLNIENYMFYKTNWIRDPVKAMKNETLLLTKYNLNDGDCLYLQDISSQLFDKYILNIYSSNQIKAFLDEKDFLIELTIDKDTTLDDVKSLLGTDIKKMRLRVLGRKLDPERILRGNSTEIKKFNLNNPANLLIETLSEEEDLSENQIQLYIFKRDSINRIYTDRKDLIWVYNQFASSDQLYKFAKNIYNDITDIELIKYNKYYYTWEIIPEMDKKGPINLRKGPFNIKDGDWIGIKESKIVDDCQTDEDQKFILALKSVNVESKIKKRNNVEKPLRIITDF